MGCTYTEGDFTPQLSEDLQNEMITVGRDKRDNQIQRFQSKKPQKQRDDIFVSTRQKNQDFIQNLQLINMLIPPTIIPEQNLEQPLQKLTLQFVNGFKVQDSRKNMFWGQNKDQIIYCAAAIGIVMNVNTRQQKYMGAGLATITDGHIHDIMSLGVCQKRKLCITGSSGTWPQIIIWDTQSMQVISKTKLSRNTRAISSIRFSKNCQYFFCADKHNNPNIYAFKTSNLELLGQNRCGNDVIFDGETGASNVFAVTTKKGVYFFELRGNVLDATRGIFGVHSVNPQICITYNMDKNVYYSGSSIGWIYEWQDNTCISSKKFHDGSIRGLQWSHGYLLSSGSKDNKLKISKGFQCVKCFDLPSFAVSLDYFHGKYLVGTNCGKIIVINDQNKQEKLVMQAHCSGQTWGLAISQKGTIYTTADDNQILQFNPQTKIVNNKGVINIKPGKKYRVRCSSNLSTRSPNQQARGIAVSKNGHVALGLNDGSLSIRSSHNLNQVIFEAKHSKEWIQVLKYSPNCDKLAVGSHDHNIYIYEVQRNNYKQIAICRGHDSFVTNIDWSIDGRYIQSNCGVAEYLFFQAQSGKLLCDGANVLRNQVWATYTVKLGWWVQGIFPRQTSWDHVNAVDRSNGKDILATGDEWGFVNLYRNPAIKKAKCLSYRAHSSHVVRVLFDQNDQYIYSVGGYDKTMMMWKIS